MITGRPVWIGDMISTDDISPTHAFTTDPEKIRESCNLHRLVIGPEISDVDGMKGTVIIAGTEFGWGSYRESAALCIKYLGVKAVIAESFGFGMYRNLINLGIPAFTGYIPPKPYENIVIDFDNMVAIFGGEKYELQMSDVARRILEHGGLMNVL